MPSAACGRLRAPEERPLCVLVCCCVSAWRRTLSPPAPEEAINPLLGTLERCCGFIEGAGGGAPSWEVALSLLAAGTPPRAGGALETGSGAHRAVVFPPPLPFCCPWASCPCELQPASPKSCFGWGRGSGTRTKAEVSLSLPVPPVSRSVPLPTQLSARAAPGFGVSSGQPSLVWPLPASAVKAWPG